MLQRQPSCRHAGQPYADWGWLKRPANSCHLRPGGHGGFGTNKIDPCIASAALCQIFDPPCEAVGLSDCEPNQLTWRAAPEITRWRAAFGSWLQLSDVDYAFSACGQQLSRGCCFCMVHSPFVNFLYHVTARCKCMLRMA
eukprot:jgi/Ulvmu1/10285/UM060_0087.1